MKKILVANRGEIALRIMRSAREMGLATVAVYSDADRLAPFVRFADEAVHIGGPASSDSYLRGDRVIEACRATGADAIHPGYGFLSENANFARQVAEAGIIFIGPTPEAMEVMGSKLAAKNAVKSYGIPLVPGTDSAIENLAEAIEVAKEIGFPLLIKASAGGGGKGMRIVEEASELESQMKRAISEAESAFGDGAVFVERYVSGPRHIEIQVLADQHGNVVHLFERECSIQRRHQKVVEEAPSSVLTPEMRDAMGKSACDVARACNYVGAGTVEFLLDDRMNYYFLEMNTRLQVEHPVTEMITGVDLVREQIKVAEGLPLSFTQEDLKIHGHAIEVRVYAEDPQNGFLPDIGNLKTYKRPEGPGIRVDDGFEEGMDIPIYYDPMIAKLVTHAGDRDQAIARMTRAINDFHISGVKTTLAFGKFAINHEAFKSGNFDTHFVKNFFSPEVLDVFVDEEARIAALAANLFYEKAKSANTASENQHNPEWRSRRN
ncbi:MAG: acetyl-CoA carboxylase biotin carboxylase subunit [Flavobacteriales bacterium]|nr:acetyl-CoA carboxylase biotin carboxylase subunit [Flavobacteriales bacterium]